MTDICVICQEDLCGNIYELPECGHLIPLEKPESFAENINKFVKQLN